MPAISPLRPVGLQLPRFEMAAAPQYQPLRTAPIPEFSRELLSIPTGGERMTAGLGQALEVLRDASVQAGLRNVMAGKPFDAPASDGFGDRAGATLRHAFDSTLGKHETAVQPSPFDRATELRDPITGRSVATLPAAGNVLAGPDGRLSYDPNRALGQSQASLALQSASTNAQLGQLQLTEAQRAAKERETLLGQPPRVYKMGPDGTTTPVDAGAPTVPKSEPPMPSGPPATGTAPASIRNNNPGAQYPGPVASRFGSTGEETIGGGHRIATFADPVAGAAAQFALLQKGYAGMPLGAALQKWTGGNSSDAYTRSVAAATGLSPDTILTPEILANPTVAIPLAKAMARVEAGRDFPLPDDGWMQAHQRAFGGIATDAAPAGQPIVKAERVGPRRFTPLTDQPFAASSGAFGPEQMSLTSTATAPGGGPLTSPIGQSAPTVSPAAIARAGGPLVADAAPGVPAAGVQPAGTAPVQADKPDALPVQPNHVEIYGRVIQGRFVPNGQLKALGLPAGRDVLQRPKFYRQDIGGGQVATFQTDPEGDKHKDQMVAGSAKPAIQATAEDQLVAKGLDPGLAPDVLREINLLKGTNPALKIKELISTMAQYRDSGRNPSEAIAAIKFGTNFKAGDPFHDAAKRAMALNPKAWKDGKDEIFDEIAANLGAGSTADARSVVEGVVRGSLKDETAKKFAGSEAILSKVDQLKRTYAQLAATNPAFRDNADPLGNNISAFSQWLAGKAGYLKDPAEATLAASAQNLLNDILREQAGQAVTNNELKRYSAVLPGITDSTQLAGLKLGQIEQFQSAVRSDVIRRQIGDTNFRAIYGEADRATAAAAAAPTVAQPATAPKPSSPVGGMVTLYKGGVSAQFPADKLDAAKAAGWTP